MLRGVRLTDTLELDATRHREFHYRCHGKMQYEDEAAAKRAAKRIGKKRQGQSALSPYECPFCNFFHLGHAPGEKKDRKPRFS